MVCPTCGGKLNPNDKFCRYCGTTIENVQDPAAGQPPVNEQSYAPPVYQPPVQEQPYTPPVYQPPVQEQPYTPPVYQPPVQEQPKKPGKKLPKIHFHMPKFNLPKLPDLRGKVSKKTLMIGGGALAAVLVIVLVVSLILSGNPTAKVGAAFASTGKELMAVADTLGLTDAADVLTQKSISQDLSLEVDTAERYSLFYGMEGMGMTVQLDTNVPKRQIGIRAIPYVGSTELCVASLALNDEMVYFGIPEILPEDLYGLNTLTLMADLEELGADLGDAADISFNLFELVEIMQKQLEAGQKESRKTMEAATSELIGSLEVEKDGKRSLRINGRSTKCAGYTVTIPQEALEDWLKALEDSAETVDYEDILEEVFEAMNLPRDIVRELKTEAKSFISGPNMDYLMDIVDDLGDVELEVYINGGKISAILFEGDFRGEDMEIGLYIGGKDAYINEISLEYLCGNEEIVITAEGNHTAKGGTFTTEITAEYFWRGEPDGDLTLELEYNTKAKEDNLSLEISSYNSLFLEGTWTTSGSSVNLIVDEFVMEDRYGEEELVLSGSYRAGKYENRISTKNAILVSNMTEDVLEDFFIEVEENASAWIEDILEENPDLKYLF